MGGAGILLCGYGPGTKDVNRKNLVFNNHIHHVGQIYLHSPGIMVWQSGENRVANNLDPPCALLRNHRFRLHDPFLPTEGPRAMPNDPTA